MYLHVLFLASRIAKMVRTTVLGDVISYSFPGHPKCFHVARILRLSPFAMAGIFVNRQFK